MIVLDTVIFLESTLKETHYPLALLPKATVEFETLAYQASSPLLARVH